MSAVSKVSITTTAPTPVLATQNGQTITIIEDPTVANWPTGNLLILKPSGNTFGTTSLAVVAGSSYAFSKGGNGYYFAGDVIGYVQAVTANTVIVVDEAGL